MQTDDQLTTEAILDALASSERVLPRVALRQAADRWPEVGPVLLEMLDEAAAGANRSERTDSILFFAVFLMGQMRETRAYRPLCAIAAKGERMSDLIGDGLTEDLPAILTRVYDGDTAPLRRLIEATGADEFARDAALATLAWLTAAGQIDRDETAGYLRDLYTTLQPQEDCYVWVGWQQAIAHLGLDDLVPLVEEAFRRDFIDPMIMSISHFQDDLNAAKQATNPTEVFETKDRVLDDVITHLSTWASFQPEEPRIPRPVVPLAISKTIVNPYRNVGRNDPCPCGSGKKFKKCCLETMGS